MTDGITIRLRSATDIALAEDHLRRAQFGWWFKLFEPTRSDKQNRRMWAMLGQVAKKGNIAGRTFDADQWKAIFMKAMGEEVDFLPSLDGKTYFPHGFRSSRLSIKEMVALQDFIKAWATEQGIELKREAE